jgi:hypothetical protein
LAVPTASMPGDQVLASTVTAETATGGRGRLAIAEAIMPCMKKLKPTRPPQMTATMTIRTIPRRDIALPFGPF